MAAPSPRGGPSTVTPPRHRPAQGRRAAADGRDQELGPVLNDRDANQRAGGQCGDRSGADRPEHKGGFNGLLPAVAPAAFGGTEAFLTEVRWLEDAIHGLDPAVGKDAVRLPEERFAATGRTGLRIGIPLDEGTAKRLLESAERLGVAAPDGF